jgi:mRNA deadenylase 3'-5' endonuclease subunit Ccr4
LIDKEEIRFNDLWERYDNDLDYKRHNVALICLLQHRETAQHILVVNTHLYWNK